MPYFAVFSNVSTNISPSSFLAIHIPVSPRCMRPMGMQEGAILDDQLTASSSIPGYESYRARPDDVGWCANAEETNPYLQVKVRFYIYIYIYIYMYIYIYIYIYREREREREREKV